MTENFAQFLNTLRKIINCNTEITDASHSKKQSFFEQSSYSLIPDAQPHSISRHVLTNKSNKDTYSVY